MQPTQKLTALFSPCRILTYALHSRNYIHFILIFSLVILSKILQVFYKDDRKSKSSGCFSVLVISNLSMRIKFALTSHAWIVYSSHTMMLCTIQRSPKIVYSPYAMMLCTIQSSPKVHFFFSLIFNF